jgi:beta-ribofuranosylaminobenzene 5'-phosphate synthase
MRVTVTTPSRLAFCLIDLNGELGRVDGCVGLALDKPEIKLYIESTDHPLDVTNRIEDREAILAAAHAISARTGHAARGRIVIRESYPAHTGLGYRTQLLLAAGKAIAALHETQLTAREIATVVRRGGTSGVGVAAFESGGFILDGGHSFGPGMEKESFVPSSASGAPPPPVVLRQDFPASWRVLCVRCGTTRGLSGSAEVEFFRRTCPIDSGEVADTSRIILMLLLPSIVTSDIVGATGAITHLQAVGFKRQIWELQPREVYLAREVMEGLGLAGVGISSLGPTMYCFVGAAEADDAVQATSRALQLKGITANVWSTKANNSGARVRRSHWIPQDMH